MLVLDERLTRVLAMTTAHTDGQATATSDPYRALLAVSEAIVSHRDWPTLFHELAGLLHPVVRFDDPSLFLPDAARSAPGGACAPRAALPAWRLRSVPQLGSFRSIRNSTPILALRGDASAATTPARPLLWGGVQVTQERT